MYPKEIQSLAHQEDTCKDNLLCCILGLRELQTRIYWLISDETMEIEDIAKKMGRDRSSVQRALQDLIMLGLATRVVLPGKKSRKFSYTGISIELLKKKLAKAADEYHDKIHKDIKKIKKR